MISFYDQLSNILIAPPGNLVYHLTLIFVLVISLQAVLLRKFDPQTAKRGRILLAITLMLILQVGLFLASAFTWQGIADQHLYLPPLDRFITTLSLILLVWVWNFPKTGHYVDTVTLLLSLITVVLFIFTLSAWSTQSPTAVFNASWLDWGWSVFSIFILFSGVLILLVQKPAAWGTGLVVFNVLLAAFTAHLIWEISAGNYSPAVRIAQLITFPLIPSLIYRLQGSAKEKAFPSQAPSSPMAFNKNWLSSTYQTESLNMVESLASGISVDLKADACVLIESKGEGNELDFLGGYDRFHERTIGYRSINGSGLVLLREIIRNAKPVKWSRKEASGEKFESVSGYLGLSSEHEEICFAPIGKKGNKEYWTIISLSKKSEGIENQLQQCVQDIQGPALQVLQHFETQKDLESKLTDLEVSLANTRTQLERMTGRKNHFEQQINDLIADEKDLDALTALQNELVSLSSTIANSNDIPHSAAELKTEGETALQRIAQLEVLLDQAHVDTSFLKEKLKQASQQMLVLQEKLVKTRKISQDSSKETETLQDMDVKPTVKSISPETDRVLPLDVNLAIDRVIDEISTMLLEKELILKLAIPDAMPAIRMEEETFAQLLERGFTFLANHTSTQGSLLLHTEATKECDFLSFHMVQQGGFKNGGHNIEAAMRAQEEDSFHAEWASSEDFKIMERIANAQGGRAWMDSDHENIAIHINLPLEAASYINTSKQTSDL